MRRYIFILLCVLLQNVYAKDKPLKCASLTDNFCNQLWSSSNKGNLEGKDFKIFLGDSKKSESWVTSLLYFQNFLDHQKEYPADFQKNTEELISDIRNHLAKEDATPEWFLKASRFFDRIIFAFQTTANQRLLKDHPHLKNIKSSDQTQSEKSLYQTYYFNLANQVMDIRFANDPNWKRVERIFAQVKNDLIQMISETFPEEARKYNIEKVKKAKLSLPYSDPRTIDASNSCVMDGTSAYYILSINTIVVCVGRFLGIQDESNFYITLAHELAHSIDPTEYAMDRFMESSVGSQLKQLCGAQGARFEL